MARRESEADNVERPAETRDVSEAKATADGALLERPGPQTTRGVSLGQWSNRQDIVSSFIIVLLIGAATIFLFALRNWPAPSSVAPMTFSQPCKSAPARGSAAQQVARISAAAAPMNIYIGRDGRGQVRQSAPLAVQKGRLCPGQTLTASVSDFVRGDGAGLPANQVAAWGQVDSTGTHVTMYVSVAPRYQQVSGSGGYSGIVALDYPGIVGANVLVNLHVFYPNLMIVVLFGLVAAFGGFTWAWLVHDLRSSNIYPGTSPDQYPPNQYFWRNFILRVAILLAAAVPVVNVQFLANPDWEGTASQYIAIATLAGAAALALTPTLRALTLPHSMPAKPVSCGAATSTSTGGGPQSAVGDHANPGTPTPVQAEEPS